MPLLFENSSNPSRNPGFNSRMWEDPHSRHPEDLRRTKPFSIMLLRKGGISSRRLACTLNR